MTGTGNTANSLGALHDATRRHWTLHVRGLLPIWRTTTPETAALIVDGTRGGRVELRRRTGSDLIRVPIGSADDLRAFDAIDTRRGTDALPEPALAAALAGTGGQFIVRRFGRPHEIHRFEAYERLRQSAATPPRVEWMDSPLYGKRTVAVTSPIDAIAIACAHQAIEPRGTRALSQATSAHEESMLEQCLSVERSEAAEDAVTAVGVTKPIERPDLLALIAAGAPPHMAQVTLAALKPLASSEVALSAARQCWKAANDDPASREAVAELLGQLGTRAALDGPAMAAAIEASGGNVGLVSQFHRALGTQGLALDAGVTRAAFRLHAGHADAAPVVDTFHRLQDATLPACALAALDGVAARLNVGQSVERGALFTIATDSRMAPQERATILQTLALLPLKQTLENLEQIAAMSHEERTLAKLESLIMQTGPRGLLRPEADERNPEGTIRLTATTVTIGNVVLERR